MANRKPRSAVDPRVELIDALIEGVDNIDGSPIHIDDNDAHDLWIHTQDQVRAWLVEERQVLLGLNNLERAADRRNGPPVMPKLDILADDGTHTYWSTHCRHGDHNLCKGMCKKCGPAAPCICPCHALGVDVPEKEEGE